MTPKMGLVALASQYELGGERAEELLTSTAQSLREAGVDIVVGKHIVENVEQALGVCDQLKDSGITTLMLLDATWQGDSIKYLFTQSWGCQPHFGLSPTRIPMPSHACSTTAQSLLLRAFHSSMCMVYPAIALRSARLC